MREGPTPLSTGNGDRGHEARFLIVQSGTEDINPNSVRPTGSLHGVTRHYHRKKDTTKIEGGTMRSTRKKKKSALFDRLGGELPSKRAPPLKGVGTGERIHFVEKNDSSNAMRRHSTPQKNAWDGNFLKKKTAETPKNPEPRQPRKEKKKSRTTPREQKARPGSGKLSGPHPPLIQN